MVLTGIKFRAYPTSQQKQVLSQWMGCARFIYNAKCDDDYYYRKLLSHSLSLTGEKIPVDQTYSQYKTELTTWLADCPSQILRNTATIWYQAYQRFFQGLAGRPTRKKKHSKHSIWLTSELFRFDKQIDKANGYITYKLFIGTSTNNIGYLSFESHRDFEIPKTITISRKNGEWSVYFCYEDQLTSPRNPIEILSELAGQGRAALPAAVDGLDRGVVIQLQSADGTTYNFTPEQKQSIAHEQKKIRKNQRRLSRQEKGSNRRAITKQRIARSHQKIANIRKDFAHKTSRALVNSDKQIFIAEDLKVKNMTATPKAKQDENGKYQHNGAKAKAGLNGVILQSAWGSLILFTAYKAAKVNKVVIKLSAHQSSQECAQCGHTHPDNRQTQDKFVCLNCGHSENADLNAAQVMRNRGIDKILSVTSNNWQIQSDHTVMLATVTRGTRGSARGGSRKTQRPKADVQSQRSANQVVVVPLTTNPGSFGL